MAAKRARSGAKSAKPAQKEASKSAKRSGKEAAKSAKQHEKQAAKQERDERRGAQRGERRKARAMKRGERQAKRGEARATERGARQAKRAQRKRVRRAPEEARAQILEATRQLLLERPPDDIGLKDVAKRVGVTHGLVSHYFGTRDALLREAMRLHLEAMRNRVIAKIAESSGDGRDAHQLIDAWFEALADPMYTRFAAWAITSSNLSETGQFARRLQGARIVADALEARLREMGREVSRDDVDFGVLVVMSAGVGYALTREIFLPALGRDADADSDEWFRTRLAELVRKLT